MPFKREGDLGELLWTDDPSSVDSCLHFVVYLNAHTHDGPRTEALHQELDTALNAGRHIILIHETRSTFGGASFRSIIEATPKWLAWNQATGQKRLYQELAVPVCGGPHFLVSARLLLFAMAQSGGHGRRSLLGRSARPSETVVVAQRRTSQLGTVRSTEAPATAA